MRGATVGAFVMETGSKAQARTAAQIFGAGASGDSASAKNMRNQDGDPKDCSSSSPDATKAPAQCGALLRLELKALTTGAGATAPAGAPSAAKDPPRPAVAQVSAPEEPCPKGLVFTDGKCAPPASASAHQCDPSDLKGCTEQCDKGNPASCGALGTLFLNGGSGAARDATKARSLLAKACDGGNVKSCVNLGILEQSGQGGAKDTTAAAKHFEQGCKDADAAGCGMLGTLFQSGDGVKKDDTRAAVLFGQACEGGQDASCAALAVMKRDGVGGAKDPAKAAELFKRACDGTDAASCNEFGEIHAFGPAKNEILAGIMFMRACNRGSAAGCANQGRVLIGGMRSDPDGAKRAFEQACIRQSQVGCASLKVLFGDTRPVFPNVAEMNTLMRSCAGGNARDCTTSGLLQVASGNKAMGMPNIDRACIMNDGFACALKKAIK
jgi:TPR repeat protein